ncbi:MAG: JAB-like toxin 1 domain-containing protein [Paludibacter sp.]|nr:JAB-like toxin 1 domain-containing protein [Paludibacter sp.]
MPSTLPSTYGEGLGMRFQVKNGNQIQNFYDAGGQKLSTRYKTLNYLLPQPLNQGEVLSDDVDVNADETVTVEGTDYLDNIEYKVIRTFDYDVTEAPVDSRYVKRIYNSEGYLTHHLTTTYGPFYNYYRRDHLGNNREVWQAPPLGGSGAGTTVQRTHYYPSGFPWNTTTGIGADVQNKKYNGKEWVEMHGLDEYDSEARWYIPSSVRTPTPDPHCEKYYDISPYAWCKNNFVNRFDPDGRDDWEVNQEGYMKKVPDTESKTDKLYVLNKKGERTETSPLEIGKGVLDNMQKHNDFETPLSPDVHKMTVSDDNKSTEMFEFLSNNTSVEYSLTNTSKTNYITTSHEEGTERGFNRANNRGFIKGEIEKISHNHPSNSEIGSPADKMFKSEFIEKTKNKTAILQIYTKIEKNKQHYHKY